MSSTVTNSVLGISQIEYWLNPIKSAENDTTRGKTAQNANNEVTAFLSYDVFLGLSVLGGFFALDHLYLRSPLTFLAKIVINFLFFGVWWIYDASQAIFNADTVKVFGLGVPGLGPKGIAAGVLGSPEPDKKHMRFFVFALALLIGGMFGADSFLVGDKQAGFIRLVSAITVFFAPIALFWWIYKLYKFFFNTKSVIEQYNTYFGAPAGPTLLNSLIGQASHISKIPIIGPIIGSVLSVIASVIENPVFIKPITNTVQSAIQPVTNTAQMAISMVDDAIDTVKSTEELAREAIRSGTSVAEAAINTAGETAKAAANSLGVLQELKDLPGTLTQESIEGAVKNFQTGGATTATTAINSVLGYVLIGTMSIITVLGFVLSFKRSNENGRQERNDAPPEPGVLRVANKKESTEAA